MPDGPLEVSFVVTAGRSEWMAVFDDSGRFDGWTRSIKIATRFATTEAGSAAIRAISYAELERAVRQGRAVRDYDSQQDEIVYMDALSRSPRPFRLRGLGHDDHFRSMLVRPERDYATDRRAIREFVRAEQCEASRRGRAQHLSFRFMGEGAPEPARARPAAPPKPSRRILWSDLGLLERQRRPDAR